MSRLNRFLSQPLFWLAAYLCWFAVLYVLSEQPAIGPQATTFPGADKVLHAVYFAGGSTGLGLAVLLWRPGVPRTTLLLFLTGMALAVGLFDEWHQSTTPGRDGNSVGDVVADVVGGVIGFFLSLRLFRFAKGRGLLANVRT